MSGSISGYSAPKVSVIMPVYNTELYVERAIISLMEQTLDDVQFIIIDDGSNDNSLSIIKEVITRYPIRKDQITLISRENRGVAATRAQGMELATGDYVIHLDSDDWAEKSWLKEMYLKAIQENADVVVCDYNTVCSGKIARRVQCPGKDGFNCVSMLLTGLLHGSSCNKLVNRSFILDKNISFLPSINFLEDHVFFIRVFLAAKVVSYVAKPFINYNQMNENSITSYINAKKVNDILLAMDYITETLGNHSHRQLFSMDLISQKLRMKYWMLGCSDGELRSYIFSLYNEENKYIWSVKLPMHVKFLLSLISYDIFPLSFFKLFIRIFKFAKFVFRLS